MNTFTQVLGGIAAIATAVVIMLVLFFAVCYGTIRFCKWRIKKLEAQMGPQDLAALKASRAAKKLADYYGNR